MTQEIVLRDRFDVPDRALVERKFLAIKAFQALVKSQMIEGLDYGVIPGTQRPTLLKPGAEKIVKLVGLADTYLVLHEEKDWDKPFFEFQIKCVLSDGVGVVSEGLGECNSLEARYRWREAKPVCPACGQETIFKSKQAKGGWFCWMKRGGCGANFVEGDETIKGQKMGRVPNEDIYSQVNTLLKMARKRALVDAALSAGRLSDLFTQDLEDMAAAAPVAVDAETGEIEEPPAPKAAPQVKPLASGPKADAGGPDAIRNVTALLNYALSLNRLWGRAQVAQIIGKDVSQLATPEACQAAAWKLVAKSTEGQD